MIRATLAGLLDADPPPAICVAYSGGRDSTVLLHALAALRHEPAARQFGLRALHVDHGIHPRSAEWAAECARGCAALGVALDVLSVRVRPDGRGLEAAAREARYAALAGALQPGEWLCTAHHAADQLETVLLHLLRGSGVHGLAGMPAMAPLGAGRLVRPLLGVPPESIAAYATAHRLTWIEDPANADPGFDRNFLRHRVLPVLAERWPKAAMAAARSSALAREAAGLLDELAVADAGSVAVPQRPDCLQLEGFRRLGGPRQRNLIRHLARLRGWRVPPERRLRTGLAELLAAAEDRQPRIAWPGGEVRRFRDRLYLLDGGAPRPDTTEQALRPGEPVELGPGCGRLRLEPARGTGLRQEVVGAGLVVGFRGARTLRLRPVGQAHQRRLKTLFQEAGVVPWMRRAVPLVFSGDQVVAVGDLWIAADAAAGADEPGFALRWEGHAPLF